MRNTFAILALMVWLIGPAILCRIWIEHAKITTGALDLVLVLEFYLDHIISAYRRTNRGAIFLDYDGTVVPQASIVKTPSPLEIQVSFRDTA